jgi:hypothetical protein
VGPCDIPKPSFFDPKGRYKHDAWSALGDMEREAAMRRYIEFINELLEQDELNSEQMSEDLDEIIADLKQLYEEYTSIRISDVQKVPADSRLFEER